jgi:ABC-type Mn2+/Zn2+ transport system ATPase subunit
MKLTPQALVGGGPVRSGDVVVSIRDAVLGLGPTETRPDGIPVVRAARLEARRGDRIGIVGPNGVGKTTLLRTVAGELYPLQGSARIGASVQLAYLAQLRNAAFPGATVLDTLLETVNVPLGEARGYLARFLFRGEDVFTPVSELSGGERSRLELALLGVTPANVLLLDEPTNHLDIPAREALETFLRESGATLLIVSHDRRLLQQTCSSLWVVEPTGPNGVDQPDGEDSATGSVPPGRRVPAVAAAFAGGYAEWRAAVADGWTIAAALEAAMGSSGVRAGLPGAAADARLPAAAHQARAQGPAAGDGREGDAAARPTLPRLSKDAYRRQKAAVEADLTRLGLRRTQLELALGTPAIQASFVELGRVMSELADVTEALAAAEDAWLSLEERAPAGRGSR